jgi:hypothetical protein
LRDKLAKGVQNAPKDPKEYEIKLSEQAAKVIKSDDPLFEAARSVAHKYGLSKEAYNGFMAEMADFVAKTAGGEQLTPEQEQAQREAYKAEQIAKLGDNGLRVVRAVNSWAEQLKSDGYLNDTDHKTLKEMANSAEAVRVLNTLRGMISNAPEVPADPISDGHSVAEIETKMVAAFNAGNEAEYMRLEQQLAKARG